MAQTAKKLDTSHLHVEVHSTKSGKVTKKWVKNDDGAKSGERTAPDQIAKIRPLKSAGGWWNKFKQYDLNKYPTDMDEKDVKVNTEGDLNTHWVMTWVDKTGKIQHAYTREFMKRNADKKWQTAARFNEAIINSIRKKSKDGIVSDDDKMRQCSAMIYIIANTGLRVGDVKNYERTGNRGVTTLHVDDVIVQGNTINFDFKGKSHKQNKAKLTDAVLAKYMEKRIAEAKKAKSKFLFEPNRIDVDKVFKKDFKFSFKIKDMRTYIACSVAKDELYKDFDDMKSKISTADTDKKKQKVLTAKLADTFKNVANKLNNTPAMAKNSYVAPQIIEDYVIRLGLSKEDLKKAELTEEAPSLDDILKNYPPVQGDIDIEEESEELCDEYPLPDWLQGIDFEQENDIEKKIELAKSIGIDLLDEDFVKNHAIIVPKAFESVVNGIVPNEGFWNVDIVKAMEVNRNLAEDYTLVRKLVVQEGNKPYVATFFVSTIANENNVN
jgi:DNA topoisomerase-1